MYFDYKYTDSFREFGEPLYLPKSDSWLLKRKIPGTSYYDAMGCYPFFSCKNWDYLFQDLERITNDLVCVSMVTDPFGAYSEEYLEQCFKDLVYPFKEHFIIDLSKSREEIVSNNHLRNIKKAIQKVSIEVSDKPDDYIDDWLSLYDNLIERHNITGILTFSKQAFEKQFLIPNTVVFRAVYNNETVGMVIFYVHDKIGYYHLGAYSNLGYEIKASFAVFWHLIDFFTRNGLLYLSLGGGAGSNNDQKGGLNRFKKGWSTGTKTAYFCGRIFNIKAYADLVKQKEVGATRYFPAYRLGEFR